MYVAPLEREKSSLSDAPALVGIRSQLTQLRPNLARRTRLAAVHGRQLGNASSYARSVLCAESAESKQIYGTAYAQQRINSQPGTGLGRSASSLDAKEMLE